MQIVAALDRDDLAQAEALMARHIGSVQDALRLPLADDPLTRLRDALAPVGKPEAQVLRTRPARRALTLPSAPRPGTVPDEPSIYLGALL